MANHPRNPNLIVTRTPLRVSFAGGGTDLPDFYQQQYGAVLSTAIDRYLYVTVKRHGKLFFENYRLNYSETEHVDRLDDVKNDIARESIRFLKVDPPIYISTVADLPAHSGLGSSSSFAVGLLCALHAYQGNRVSAGQLAEEAAHIEIEVLKRPIGKQDHYAAAFGGLNYICFLPDGGVSLEHQRLSSADLDGLFQHVMMFWTSIVRDSGTVLTEQKRNTPSKMEHLLAMRDQAKELRALLQNGFAPKAFAGVLDAGWQLKRQLASSITNDRIDLWHRRAMEAGALGGKLCGAGGGGFLLFVVAPDRQEAVRQALSDLTEIRVGYEAHGSSLLFVE
jgi:D-glycero-alpha-D-manno-heptose-7-phosphate kinase